MILNKIIFTIGLLFVGIVALKVGVFYFIARLRQSQFEQAKGNHKGNFNKNNKYFNSNIQPTSKELSMPSAYLKYYCLNQTAPSNSVTTLEKPIPRSEEIESKYTEVKTIFNSKMKNKEMNRDEILALRNYLTMSVHQYEEKKFKNDAHCIYSLLKSKDLTMKHLEDIEGFLNSLLRKDDLQK